MYNPGVDRTQMDDQQKLDQDHFLLLELLPEFCFLSNNKIELFATDELTRGLSNMTVTKSIPVWLAFATTVLLDIHHLTKDKAHAASKQMQLIAGNGKSTLSWYFDFSRGTTSSSIWPKQNEQYLKLLAWHADNNLLDDIVLYPKQQHHAESGHPFSLDIERFYLYKRQPILCGLLAFRLGSCKALESLWLGRWAPQCTLHISTMHCASTLYHYHSP